VNGDEEVVAFVQPSAGSAVTETELAAHAAEQLVAYKQPSQIVLQPTMPTTPTGKIRKDELSKMAADRAPVR
jgi:acyl-coenzyme A synthetase/AMP-(fatty) acid ligase